MRILSTLFALLLLSANAQALQIERVTTVTDDHGGNLVISSSGSAFADGGSSTAELVASSFSLRGQGTVDAQLLRERSRSVEAITAVYNGSATLSATNASGEPVTIDIELVDLGVLREGTGPEFSGTVIINGSSFDASALPERARGLVGRLLALFAFA